MNNNKILELYNDLKSENLANFENKILEESLNNSFSINELKDILKKYLTKISKLEIDFENLKNDLISNLNESKRIEKDVKEIKEEHLKNFEESTKKINEMKVIKDEFDRKINFLNTFMIWILVVFFITFLWFIIEEYFRFHNVKEEYINQTVENKKELEKQIELFKKEQEELKEDNQKLKENIKNELEKDIYKTILQTNLKN